MPSQEVKTLAGDVENQNQVSEKPQLFGFLVLGSPQKS